MGLDDITNKSANKAIYQVSFHIPPKYAPAIPKGKDLDENPTHRLDFVALRQQGGKNLDLWMNRAIYPIDPQTTKPPDFTTIKGLAIFTTEGESGLLGYTCSLCNQPHLMRKTRGLEGEIYQLQ